LYGGSYNQFKVSFRNLGIEVRFAASQNPEDYRLLIDEKTRAIYTETIGNPGFTIPDFDGLSRLCTDNGIPLIVDNTFAGGGYLCRPIKYGANIVVESATKWIGGHGTSMGGVIIDGGNFNWANGKFPQFTEPSQAYHGLVYTKKFTETKAGNVAFITRARAEGLRDFGPCMSPFNAFQLLTGLETLSLRMQRHCENAKSLALWLAARPEVEDVNNPGLESSQGYANAVRYLRNGFGGVLSVTLKGGRKQACKLVESLKMIRHLANVGDVRTLIIQPASTTHRQLSEDELLNAGINPGLLRISAGIEHIDDIIHDFQQALERCG
ncbi:MAG: aminotransferase class I/II-fold pyridoxal phosphate-dependent enzyme, partial [Bacteroidota bacterium]